MAEVPPEQQPSYDPEPSPLMTVYNPMQGPLGQSCQNEEDCKNRNKEYYTKLFENLKGYNGANGEKGPRGSKGPKGPKGKRGNKGIDGVPFSKDYLD